MAICCKWVLLLTHSKDIVFKIYTCVFSCKLPLILSTHDFKTLSIKVSHAIVIIFQKFIQKFLFRNLRRVIGTRIYFTNTEINENKEKLKIGSRSSGPRWGAHDSCGLGSLKSTAGGHASSRTGLGSELAN